MPRLIDHALDPAKLDAGIWWNYERKETCKGNKPDDGAGCFLIVPLVGNVEFQNAMQAGELKHSGTLRDTGDTPESVKRTLRQQIWAEATASYVLRGWAGWSDLPEFSKAKAIEILTDRKMVAVAEFVFNAAQRQDAALLREEEQAKGN